MADNKKTADAERSRGWFITINEAAQTDEISYDNMEAYILGKFNPKRLEYFAYNEEVGESGNRHIHLYIEFKDVKTFSAVHKKFPRCRLDERLGTPTEARDYLSKPDKGGTLLRPRKEWGDFTRLATVKARGSRAAHSGAKAKPSLNDRLKEYVELYDSIEEVEDVDLWFAKQYRSVLTERFLTKKENALFDRIGSRVVGSRGQTVDMLNRKIFYLWGDSRTGKTFGIKMKYGSANVYTPSTFQHLFDDYKGQQVLNLDEFRSDMPFRDLLVLFQGYREHNKLSARYENNTNLADTIIISTNIPITEQYANVRTEHSESWRAFFNRFNAGVWELIYSPADDKRLLCCTSRETDYSPAARASLDFSEPPIDLNEGVVWIREREDFMLAKGLVRRGESALPPAIEALKAAAMAEPDPDAPF